MKYFLSIIFTILMIILLGSMFIEGGSDLIDILKEAYHSPDTVITIHNGKPDTIITIRK